MSEPIGLARIAEIAQRALASGAEAIAAVAELTQRLSGVDITVVSETAADGRYVFRAIESRPALPVRRDDAIPYAWSLCSRVHAGESPATVPDTREVPALWAQWLRLKEGLGVDWDVRAFCTRDVVLPDGSRFGTLCLHHRQPRAFSADEESLLEVLGRLLGQEIWRERAAAELSAATTALAEAERLRMDLAEELRHELRAPLQVIDGYGEGMLDGVLERTDEHLGLVREEAARAMRLLDDVLELTRLEVRPDATVDGAPVRLDVVAREMCAHLAPIAEAAGIALVAETEPVSVRGDRRRVEQLVVNLVRNALRALAGGAGTRVLVSVAEEGDEALLTVVDDGPGIPEDDLGRVFDRFYRGGSAGDERPGSGLGLTIARRIVEGLGGAIAASAAPGGGARVAARLPLAGE